VIVTGIEKHVSGTHILLFGRFVPLQSTDESTSSVQDNGGNLFLVIAK